MQRILKLCNKLILIRSTYLGQEIIIIWTVVWATSMVVEVGVILLKLSGQSTNLNQVTTFKEIECLEDKLWLGVSSLLPILFIKSCGPEELQWLISFGDS